MHADARIVEKDVDIWLTFADKTEPRANANARIQNVEKIIRRAFGNTSKWKVYREYPFAVGLVKCCLI